LRLFREKLFLEVRLREEEKKKKFKEDVIISERNNNSFHNEAIPTEIVDLCLEAMLLITICLICKKSLKTKCNHVTSEEIATVWKFGSTCKRYRVIVLKFIKRKRLEFLGSPDSKSVHGFFQMKRHVIKHQKEYHIEFDSKGENTEIREIVVSDPCKGALWNEFLMKQRRFHEWTTMGVDTPYMARYLWGGRKLLKYKFTRKEEAKEYIDEKIVPLTRRNLSPLPPITYSLNFFDFFKFVFIWLLIFCFSKIVDHFYPIDTWF